MDYRMFLMKTLEEAGIIDKQSHYTWVIDPTDGTSNFAQGSPLYGCMLGLLKDHEPLAGGFALPAFHEIYSAERGKGAYCFDFTRSTPAYYFHLEEEVRFLSGRMKTSHILSIFPLLFFFTVSPNFGEALLRSRLPNG